MIDLPNTLGSLSNINQFSAPITHVYNPLDYAREGWQQYVERYARAGVEAVLVGMNPGPWGMAQTGVPFGEVNIVRDWLRIDAKISKPKHEHPKRPVDGFNCRRSEVSGARLWGWARERFVTPEEFFKRFFVYNYCPLMFLEESGRNFPPEKLHAAEGQRLFEICDEALRQVVRQLMPKYVIGVGGWAEGRIRAALWEEKSRKVEKSKSRNAGRNHEGVGSLKRTLLDNETGWKAGPTAPSPVENWCHIDTPVTNRCHMDVIIGRILHPSPASPAANRGWAKQAEADLKSCGISL